MPAWNQLRTIHWQNIYDIYDLRIGNILHKFFDRWQNFLRPEKPSQGVFQREYFTKVILSFFTGTLVVISFVIIVGWISGALSYPEMIIIVCMSLFGALGLWLCSHGYWHVASYFPTVLTLVLASYMTFLSGLITTGLLFYIIAISLSAILQKAKVQWLIAGISFSTHLIIAVNYHAESDEHLLETIITVGGAFLGIALLNSFISSEWTKAHFKLQREAREHRRSKERLEDSERQYRMLFEYNLAGVYRSTLEGKIVSCNQAFADIFGYKSPEDAVKDSAFEYYQDPDDREKFISLLTKHSVVKNIESRFKHQDGRMIWGIESSNLFEEKSGQGKIIQGTIIDITELKEEQKLQDALRLIALSTQRAANIDVLYAEIHKIIKEVMDAKNFYIALYDSVEDLLHFPYLVDEEEDSVEAYKPRRGLTEYVLRSGKALLCDTSLHEELASQGEVEYIGPLSQIWLGVPLFLENEVIGVMAIQHYTNENAYTHRELYILEFVSSQIVHAITHKQAEQALWQAYGDQEQRVNERTRELRTRIEQVEILNKAMTNLMEDLKANQQVLQDSQADLESAHQRLKDERIQEQASLLRLSQALLVEHNHQTIINLAVDEVSKVMDVDLAAIALVEGKGKYFSGKAALGWDSEIFKRIKRIPINDDTGMGRAIGSKKPSITYDASKKNIPKTDFISMMKIQASLIVPMLAADQAIGGLAVDCLEPRQWTDEEARILSLIANTTAQALERARLFSKVSEGRQRLQALTKRLVDVQENERREVARELHDQIGQSLSAIKLKLQAAENASDPKTISSELNSLVELTDNTLKEVRDLSRDLLPSVLDDFGLNPALTWYLDQQKQVSNIVIKLESDFPDKRYETEIEITTYRIIQIAVTNMIQYSEAKNATLRVWANDLDLCIELQDDGVGFDVEKALLQAKQGKTLGLLNLIERAELVGGTAEISSTPGDGTLVEVRLPVSISQTLERRMTERKLPAYQNMT